MRRSSAIFGVILLVVGGLLLADSLGLFSFLGVGVWQILWPLVLVAFGVWVLIGATRSRPHYASQAWSLPLEGVAEASVELNFGAGELRLGSGAPAGTLLAGTFEGGLEHDVRQSGGHIDARLSSPMRVWWLWSFGPGDHRRWQVQLDDATPVTLVVKTGASDCRLDMADLNVKELRIESGAAAVQATLPAHAGYTEVRGSNGAASLSLRIPEGVAARISAQGGLASVSVDRGRFPRSGGVYVSPDYETAQNKVDVRLDMGVGSITIH